MKTKQVWTVFGIQHTLSCAGTVECISLRLRLAHVRCAKQALSNASPSDAIRYAERVAEIREATGGKSTAFYDSVGYGGGEIELTAQRNTDGMTLDGWYALDVAGCSLSKSAISALSKIVDCQDPASALAIPRPVHVRYLDKFHTYVEVGEPVDLSFPASRKVA